MRSLAGTIILGLFLGFPVAAPWSSAACAQTDISSKEAFEAAKELNTPEAWNGYDTTTYRAAYYVRALAAWDTYASARRQ